MSERTILVWFRNDLRVQDNEILLEATRKADKVLPVYCFDPHYFHADDDNRAVKTGSIRAQFLLESVADLRQNLRNLGGELLIVHGHPADVIPQLAEQYQVNEVYHHREVAIEETAISEQVEAALWKMKLNLKHFIGHTLYHKEDLPFPIKDIPDSFNTFKKKVERDSDVRPCIVTPDSIVTPLIADAGELPTLEQLGLTQPVQDARASYSFKGGETAAQEQIEQFFLAYGSTSMGKGNKNILSSKLSPWLSFGCISPRQVYWEIMKHEHGNNHPLMLELLWRDYFRFMFKKYSRTFFDPEGFKGAAPELADNQEELFDKWKTGTTGEPFIDASMHELNATGFIGNASRQALSYYLVKNLKVDWTRGAKWFEEKLIDYSPASNWGNWAYIAGVGNDPRENRYFNPKSLAELDPKGEYVKLWLTEEKVT